MEPKRAKLPIFVLSMLVSIFLWMHVQTLAEPPRTPGVYSLRLEYRDLPPHLAIVNRRETVTLTAQGSPEDIRQIDGSVIRPYVDLKDAVAGTQRYPVMIADQARRYKVEWRQVTVEVRLERIVRRQVPVTIVPTRELSSEGLVFVGAEPDPNHVTIEGPSSIVETVERVRGFLDLGEVSMLGTTSAVDVVPVDKGYATVSGEINWEPRAVTVRLQLAPVAQRKLVLVSAVYQGSPDPDFKITDVRVEPARVELTGPIDQLGKLNFVETSPINIQGLKEDATFVTTLRLPSGINPTRDASVRVSLRVMRRAEAASER